jgi:hypothetical protein
MKKFGVDDRPAATSEEQFCGDGVGASAIGSDLDCGLDRDAATEIACDIRVISFRLPLVLQRNFRMVSDSWETRTECSVSLQ